MAEEDIKFDVIARDALCADKLYLKLLKKQQKEMEVTKKRHQKERTVMQRAQCTVADRLVATCDKEKVAAERSAERNLRKSRCVDGSCRPVIELLLSLIHLCCDFLAYAMSFSMSSPCTFHFCVVTFWPNSTSFCMSSHLFCEFLA